MLESVVNVKKYLSNVIIHLQCGGRMVSAVWIRTDKSSNSGLLSVWIGTAEPCCRLCIHMSHCPHPHPNPLPIPNPNPKSYPNLKLFNE